MKLKTLNDAHVQVAGCTDIGKVRQENQDQYMIMTSVAPIGVTGVLAVADGMGGHKGGAVASKLAIACIRNCFSTSVDETANQEDKNKFLKSAIEKANTDVHQKGSTPEHLGMGTTLTVIQINENNEYGLAHVGDSRAYLIRDGAMKRISTDHSLVGEQVIAGVITEEEARVHPQRNVITRAIGLKDKVEPEIDNGMFKNDDILVLCSDGLHGLVSDNEIQDVATRNLPEMATARLVSLANEAGGADNITVIIARFGNIDLKNTIETGNRFVWLPRFWLHVRRLLKV